MSDLDRKLFACHRADGYSEAEWREILGHVVAKLARSVSEGKPSLASQLFSSADGRSRTIWSCDERYEST